MNAGTIDEVVERFKNQMGDGMSEKDTLENNNAP